MLADEDFQESNVEIKWVGEKISELVSIPRLHQVPKLSTLHQQLTWERALSHPAKD